MSISFPQLATHNECTGCSACIDACGVHALSLQLAKDGHLYPQINIEKCIGCRLCEQACPIVSGFKYDESKEAFFYAAWNKNREERKNSASGGAFSAMAHYVIDKGGVVIGATTEKECEVRHKAVICDRDLPLLQGSKYTQSITVGIYTQTIKFLQEGRMVLFSGTGCQVSGLYSFLKNKKFTGNLITVDLICGGVPSKLLLQKFIENEPYKIKRILSYRTKEKGWRSKGFIYNMKVEDADGIIHDYSGNRNLVTTALGIGLTQRYSCYYCRFVGKKRMSDFTIGDLWGDEKFPEQHFEGLSLLIAHNSQGEELLCQMKDYLHTEQYDPTVAIKSNKRLVNGRIVSRYTFERKFMTLLFSHCSYRILKKLYANDYSNISPWMVLKVCRYLYLKLLCLVIKK